ncbi:MAG: DsrE family protein [Candidatus Methanoperedens sp.]|nr:DsrE family protein [Candidatus Methanoperedens sp.]MCZ7361619.1 DsrE family protein [Candidatus Methanoperedens sp.]HLB70354.1 DsrE family protein [Candidatus Methanoperedens sp.]
MSGLLLVLSKDPYTTEIPDLVLDIGMDAKGKGNDVTLYLVEDGVTAARKTEFGNKLAAAHKKGIKIYADDKAVLSRSLENKLIGWVEIKEIGTLLDFIMDYDRVAWF